MSGNLDRLSLHPYFVFKLIDLVTVFLFLLGLCVFIFIPNALGHYYIPANPMQTPSSIVP